MLRRWGKSCCWNDTFFPPHIAFRNPILWGTEDVHLFEKCLIGRSHLQNGDVNKGNSLWFWVLLQRIWILRESHKSWFLLSRFACVTFAAAVGHFLVTWRFFSNYNCERHTRKRKVQKDEQSLIVPLSLGYEYDWISHQRSSEQKQPIKCGLDLLTCGGNACHCENVTDFRLLKKAYRCPWTHKRRL